MTTKAWMVFLAAALAAATMGTTALARPVNPAQGWLLDLGFGVEHTSLAFSADPKISVATPWSTTDFLISDMPGVRHSGHQERSTVALLGLGYGWSRFAGEFLIGPKLMTVEWKEYDAITGKHLKDFEVAAPGVAFGTRLEGTPFRSGGFSLDLDFRLLLSIHRDSKVYETKVSTGERKEYYEANAVVLKRYEASMVGVDSGVGLTGSWAVGAFVPWLALKARNEAMTLNWSNEFVLPMSWSLKDYNLKSAKSFSPAAGLDWNFNRNATVRLEPGLANPASIWLSLFLCSGERP